LLEIRTGIRRHTRDCAPPRGHRNSGADAARRPLRSMRLETRQRRSVGPAGRGRRAL